MAGLVPAIHEFSRLRVVKAALGPEMVFRHYHVDGRDKPGHDADSGAQALALPR